MESSYKIGDGIEIETQYGNYILTIREVAPVTYEGRKVIIIRYRYRNTSYKGTLLINQNDFKVYDSENKVCEFCELCSKKALPIKKGELSDGQVAYYINDPYKKAKLVYDENCNVSDDPVIELEW